MKNLAATLTTLLVLLGASPALAVHIIIESPCDATPWHDSQRHADAGQSVGQVTIAALQAAGMLFVGTDAGINSIRGSVTGDDALEVVSGTEMRAYGWCFSFNGIEPDRMPDQLFVTGEQDVIRWFFGFAHYKDGAWITYCTPTNQARPDHICR